MRVPHVVSKCEQGVQWEQCARLVEYLKSIQGGGGEGLHVDQVDQHEHRMEDEDLDLGEGVLVQEECYDC